jgi:hypothetical protein
MMTPLFLLLLFPLTVFADDPFNLSDEEISPETETILLKKPEKYLRDESMLFNFNSDRGISDQRSFTGEDNDRLSVAAHISADYEHVTDILGGDITYMHRNKRYNRLWYGAQLFHHSTYFDAITRNHSGETAPQSESAFQRPGSAKNTLTAAGLGVGYRFKFFFEFIPTEDWFEQVDVFVNYLNLDESFINQTYRGYGLTANYGVHKRVSRSFFYGGKLSYNAGLVTREAIERESKSERTLSLGWLTLALELGVFF